MPFNTRKLFFFSFRLLHYYLFSNRYFNTAFFSLINAWLACEYIFNISPNKAAGSITCSRMLCKSLPACVSLLSFVNKFSLINAIFGEM